MDDQLSSRPFGNALELFLQAADADEFVASVREGEPERAAHGHVVSQELDAGSRN